MTAEPTPAADDLALYSRVAQRSSARVIREYSTSFGAATRLLGRDIRPHIESIYGLVRIADEIVDGAAGEAGLGPHTQCAVLNALEADTEATMHIGYSANLVVHAFACTARIVGIDVELTRPFFNSMRRDLDPAVFTDEDVRTYIYGSAEVVGLMCLQVFLHRMPCDPETHTRLEDGARRLGAAFQKINFLRDLRTDWHELGRNYFPGLDPEHLTESQKLALVTDIDADLNAAAAAIPDLPRSGRIAVDAAHGLFAALTERIRATPAADLLQQRVRVSNARKLRIILHAATRIRTRRTQ